MANKKIFTAVLLLAAAALLFSSCAFKMDSKQSAHYEGFITSLEVSVNGVEMSADEVKTYLSAANITASVLDYKIVDKTPDKPVAKGTKADALKKRFKPAKK